MKGGILICFEFVACYFALIQIFGDICTFSLPPHPHPPTPFLRVMSHPEQNPSITKQLDQKPPVMQQGSDAPYLLPRWEMEGERVSGREGRRIWEGGRGGRTARTGVWLTDRRSHFPDIKKSFVFSAETFALCLLLTCRTDVNVCVVMIN